MSATKQKYTTRILGVIKQAIAGLSALTGQINLVANTADDCLYAVHSDGRKVNLESTAGETYLVPITGAVGKRTVATLPAGAVADTVTFLCPDGNLLPNDGTVTVKPQINRNGAYTDLAAGDTLATINTDKKVAYDCAVIVTQAADALVVDVAGGAVTQGTFYVAYTLYYLPTA